MKKRIFAALLALCLTALTGCDWSTADPEDIFGTLTDYYNVEQKKQDVKLTSFALPYLKGETADPITCPDGAMQTLGALVYEGLFYALGAAAISLALTLALGPAAQVLGCVDAVQVHLI